MVGRKRLLILAILVSALLITGLVAALDQTVLSTGDSSIDSAVKIEGVNELWMTTGGMTAFPETPQNFAGLKRYGWGLQGSIKPNLKNWIHISPPSIYGSEVRGIEVDYSLGTGAKITMIDVWDGDEKIYHEAVTIPGTGSYTYVRRYFTPNFVNEGLTICVHVEGGPVQANNKFVIGSAQALIKRTFV